LPCQGDEFARKMQHMGPSWVDDAMVSSDQSAAGLPYGCLARRLTTHADARGALAEVFRHQWFDTPSPARWVSIQSQANVLRGVYLHSAAWTYLCLLGGRVFIGLHDMRPAAATAHQGFLVAPDAMDRLAIAIPPGIAHGLYCPEGAMHLSATSAADAAHALLLCRWNCPELKIDWPCTAPTLDPAEAAADNYVDFAARYGARAAGPAA